MLHDARQKEGLTSQTNSVFHQTDEHSAHAIKYAVAFVHDTDALFDDSGQMMNDASGCVKL